MTGQLAYETLVNLSRILERYEQELAKCRGDMLKLKIKLEREWNEEQKNKQ